MGLYCETSDVTPLLELIDPDSGAVEDAIAAAEIDIDALLSYGGDRDEENFRAVKVSDLTDWDAEMLKRATAAQAAYRLAMGPSFFTKPQYSKVKGPEFETEGQLDYYAPTVLRHLEASDLLMTPEDGPSTGNTARARYGRYSGGEFEVG